MSGTGELLWTPPPERAQASRMADFIRWLSAQEGRAFGDHESMWAWSVEHVERFWVALWDYAGVRASAPYEAVLNTHEMPGARWFTGARLNYAEHMLRHDGGAAPALISVTEDGDPAEMSWDELRRQVAGLAAWLRDLGVRPGDRVAAYLPNCPQAVVALLATASVGAVWACCSPDFGVDGAIGRLQQVEPVVLFLVDGYRWQGTTIDRRAVGQQVRAALPTVRHTVFVPYAVPDASSLGELPEGLGATTLWSEAIDGSAEPGFERVEFNDPLWVLYTSGTTGLPKGLVHSQGGILLEHLKFALLYQDLRPGQRFFIYSSTGWMMWNALVAGLLAGATVVLYDGSPTYPDAGAVWRVAARTRARVLGMGAALVTATQKSGIRPGERDDLTELDSLVVTGSPLPADGYRWFYDAVSGTARIDSLSGGTDVCTAFVGGCEMLPVYAGEISCRYAGAKAEAWDVHGKPVVGEVGELVITEPMPSMPIYFWNDPDGTRYRDAYFDMWPGVWRHGDWVTVTERGTVVIHGRSDATLNRHGVRLGSGEIYEVVEALPEVRESLVVGVERPDGGYYMPLFVVPVEGVAVDDALRRRIRDEIRANLSPRHVPDEIVAAPGVPHTLTGKRLEVPIKRLFQGVAVERAVNLGAVDRPELVQWYAEFAAQREAAPATQQQRDASPPTRQQRDASPSTQRQRDAAR
jgi:acetoacetyl-CoA synthetase